MTGAYNEPWRFLSVDDPCSFNNRILDCHDCPVTDDETYYPSAPDPDQMRRIVACVNFCADVATEELEREALARGAR